LQTRGAPLATRRDSSRAPRDAVDGIRDAKRGEDDAHLDAQKPSPTSTSLQRFSWEALAPFASRGSTLGGREQGFSSLRRL
jgi:hypothetical protein